MHCALASFAVDMTADESVNANAAPNASTRNGFASSDEPAKSCAPILSM
jgi:hypothetical protein